MSDPKYTVELEAREGPRICRYRLLDPSGRVLMRSASKHPLNQWAERLQVAFDLGRTFTAKAGRHDLD